MRFLLLNQTFHPDVAATAQYLTELALALVQRGHQVTVLASRRAYDSPEKLFPKREQWRGIRIIRAGSTSFGKGAKWRRAADFASFLSLCLWRLALLPRHDAIIALTSPPLISFIGAWLARLWRASFFYWVMDFNPDEAIAAGWLASGSLTARALDSMSRFSLRRARKVIALDRFMRDRIVAKRIAPERVVVLPPWSHDDEVRFDAEGRKHFREAHGLDGKFVVMYSGNHSPCHPLDTLLQAAERLRDDPGIVFCFVGGGSEWRRLQSSEEPPRPTAPPPHRPTVPPKHRNTETPKHRSPAQLCLPYQPLTGLSASLSAADLHVVVMGDAFVGLVHPSKIYNILAVGAPVLYIGPRVSHVTEIVSAVNGEVRCFSARHGEVDAVVAHILRARSQLPTAPPSHRNTAPPTHRNTEPPPHRPTAPPSPIARALFSKASVLPRLIAELESGTKREESREERQ